jgi:YfiH family protein
MAVMEKRNKARRKKPAQQGRDGGESSLRMRRAGGLQIVEAVALAGLPWLTHGFSSRVGGASELNQAERERGKNGKVLNLGFTEWDQRERVIENRKRFFQALGAGKMRVVTLRQIHSDIVHRIDEPEEGAVLQGDALITQNSGVLLTVQTADCIPILLADTKKRAVAAIHSGWRGTARRIAEKALGRMQMEFGTRPEDVIAAIGPGIGQCCYEVGEDVAKEFHAQFPEARDWFEGPFDALASGENDPNWLPWLTMRPPGHAPPSPRAHLDLIAANRWILGHAGVPRGRIYWSSFCTNCKSDLFFSYRREKGTGRMMAAIGVR